MAEHRSLHTELPSRGRRKKRGKKHCEYYSLKRLNLKELPSRPVGLSFHGPDALCLSLLKAAGTTADKKWKERK